MSRAVAPFVLAGLPVLAVLPSLAWIALDQSVWLWDQALYGEVSVTLYDALRHRPSSWPNSMLVAFATRAPGIAWVGQFFVPLGLTLNSIEFGLLLFIVAVQAASLVVLFGAYRSVAGGRAAPALVGWLLLAAAPMFVAMTHQYFTEPLQFLGVAWFVAIMTLGGKWSRTTLLAHLVGASAFAMLAKVSSPLYCALPGMVGLWLLLRRPAPPKRHLNLPRDGARMVGLAAALALLAGAAGWYAVNWVPITEYVRSSSSGAIAEYYGTRASFVSKLINWLNAAGQCLAYPPVLCGLVLVLGLALVVAAAEWRGNWSAGVTVSGIAAIAAVVEIVLALCVFSTQVNDDSRYLFRLGPYAGLVVAWAMAKVRQPLLTRIAATALLCQLVLVYAHALGTLSPDPVLSSYLSPLTLDRQDREEVEQAVEATCSPNDAGRMNIVGVDLDWINNNALSFFAAKRLSQGVSLCYYRSLGAYESDPDRAWDGMLAQNVNFFVTADPITVSVPPDLEFLNRVSVPILQRVRTSPLFTAMPSTGSQRLLIFKRAADP